MIGILCPSENELNPLLSLLTDRTAIEIAKLKFHSGIYRKTSCVAVFSGVCKVNAAIATQILIDKFYPELILVSGVAGSLSRHLHIGDIVVPQQIAYHDVAEEILTGYHPWMESVWFTIDESLIKICKKIDVEKKIPHALHFGKAVTGEKFVTPMEKASIISTFTPLCVDMESAAVAHVCHANNTKLLVVRAVSDNADENGHDTFEKNIVDSSAIAARFTKEFLDYYIDENLRKQTS